MAPDDTNSTRSNRGRGRGRGDGSRGNARGRGQKPRGRGNDTPRAGAAEPAANAPTQGDAPPPTVEGKAPEGVPATAEGDEVCFICADPIKFHSVAPCNHKTCHICGLRMRALYKTKDCPHCRTAAPFVVFTEDPLKRFEDYTEADITSLDHNIGIKYASEDIVGDTVVLLRYNCPVDDCVFAGLGWPDLHRHVRSVHQRKMCDLCTRNKKVFTHEHELFTDKELEKHMRRGDDQPGALDQTGFKGHPLCGFCGSRFYDDDRLYDHCREKHERCFLCDRRDSRHPHYYVNYEALEKHFTTDHFPCLDRECQERKFVVFESEMDLKAHQLSEHGNTLSKDVRRDARMVDLSDFDYRQTYQPERRRGGAGGSRGGRDGGRAGRGRGRDPNAEPIPQSSAQPMRRDELAYQRQLAIHSAQSVTNRTFGGQLSAPASSPTPAQAAAAAAAVRPPNASRTTAQAPTPGASAEVATADSASATPADRARNLRHAAVIERASNLLGQDAVKLAKFRDHISAYRTGKLKAPQLIDAFFALFSETSSNALGTLVREVADLFEDRGKAQAIQTAWQDWRAINEDYPSLPGLGGMEGATTSSSGWANAATPSIGAPAASANQKQASRVLRLKSSTRRQSASSSSSTGPGPGPGPSQSTASSLNWAATVPATSTRPPPSSAFPALSAPATGSSSGPSRPSWIGPNNHGQSGSGRASRAVAGNKEDNFPALPMAPKPLTTIFGYGNGRGVRRDFGVSRDTGFSWGGGSAGDSGNPSEKEEEVEEPTGGKKKKGNKGKKVLVQWG